MNNKDEKTFADLFSSSTLEDEETKNFDNIFKENKQEEQDEKESKEQEFEQTDNTLTFDNIVDDLGNVETAKPVEINIFNNNTEIEPQKEKLTESTEPVVEDIKVSEEENNPFFENEKPKEENLKEETLEPVIENTLSQEENNPFFTNEENETENNETLQESAKTVMEDTTFKEENNHFFENEELKIETKELEEEIQEHVTENKTVQEESNPFFANKENEISTPIIDLKLKEGPKENLNEEPSDNPFFKNENSTEETKRLVTEEKKVVEVKKEDNTAKSTSPFFVEEKTEETNNPFFEGQLNLVENKEHNNPIGNVDLTKSKHYNVKIVKKKESPIKFIIGVISYALFIFLLLIGITLLIYVLDTKIRAAKGDFSSPTFNAYVVLTGSMLPEIEVNDVVVTKKVDASTLKEGDIITFASADSRFQGTIITHRIIKKNPADGTNGYTFQTRGDNNNVADSALVPEANIFGKVILKIPKLGYLQEFLASDGGWIIVILIPCLTVMSYDIVKLFKGLKRKKYKNIKVQK